MDMRICPPFAEVQEDRTEQKQILVYWVPWGRLKMHHHLGPRQLPTWYLSNSYDGVG
jgi:hypothetical protein